MSFRFNFFDDDDAVKPQQAAASTAQLRPGKQLSIAEMVRNYYYQFFLNNFCININIYDILHLFACLRAFCCCMQTLHVKRKHVTALRVH